MSGECLTAPKLRFVLAALACLFSASLALPQVDPGFEPVPAANLSEGTLNVPDENFSAKAPGIEWEWLRGTQAAESIGRSYLCRNLRTGERFLLTVSRPGPESAEKLAAGILEEMRKSREAQGGQLVNARYQPTDTPMPGSYRLSAMITSGGPPIYFTAYAVAANRLYVLQHYSDGPKESAAFRAFARSFGLTTPVATPAKNLFSEVGALGVYASILVVFVGLGSLVNALARKPVMSGALVAFVLIMIVATLRVAGELAGKADAERMGHIVGEALLPAAIAAWLHIRYSKKQRGKAGRSEQP